MAAAKTLRARPALDTGDATWSGAGGRVQHTREVGIAEHVERGVLKVLELVGGLDQSFSDAVRSCVTEASKTIRGITGVKVVESSAKVRDGQLTEYHVTCRVVFPVERGGLPA